MSKIEELWALDEYLDAEEFEALEKLSKLHRQRSDVCSKVFEMHRALCNEYAMQHNLMNHLQGELQRKQKEASFRDVLDALLPIIASLTNEISALDETGLDAFKEENLPIWREMVSYELEKLGITLMRHEAGDEIPDFDETLEVRAAATGEASLDGKVNRSVEWGYSIGDEAHREVHKEILYVWVYNPELDTSEAEDEPKAEETPDEVASDGDGDGDSLPTDEQ